MYIGNDGVVGLFDGLLIDCMDLCKTDEITFEIVLSGENNFTLGLTSRKDINPFIQQFTNESKEFSNYYPKVLKIVSEEFEIINKDNAKTEVAFSFNKEIISNTNIDYLKLTEKVSQIALLNRQCEIITIDKRQKYLIQNYFHCPQGVFYLFDRATTEVLGEPVFKLTFDDKVNSNWYQIGFAFRTDWYPTPNIISFANNVPTICGGSLVDGILDGLISACKTYVKENNLATHKITRKKCMNGLIIVCAVRGKDYEYGGSFKETLEDNRVKKQAKKITTKLVLDFLNNQKDKADKFLWRFDTKQLTSGMY
jgi:DNA gyrase/topoisomerase IV subunit B